jgi:hypothetical protein
MVSARPCRLLPKGRKNFSVRRTTISVWKVNTVHFVKLRYSATVLQFEKRELKNEEIMLYLYIL